MESKESPAPVTFFFVVLPFGISNGFLGVTLPFVLTRAGFSVAAAGAIVALGLSANLCNFLWAPVIDLTLSLRRWYLIGLAACVSTLCLLGFMPLRQDAAIFLTAVAFLAQVGSTLVSIPVTGLMAHTVPEGRKGRAAGWYQASNLGGNGFGGGAGVWLASHYSPGVAGAVLAGSMVLCALALRFIPDVRPITHERLWPRLRLMGKDLAALVRSPIGRLTIVLVACPIGAAAMNNLWSAVAPDW